MLLVIGSRALHKAGLIETQHIEKSDWDFIADEVSWEQFKGRMFGAEVPVQSPNVRAFKCMHNGRETYFEAYVVKDWGNAEVQNSNELLLSYAATNMVMDGISQMYWATPEMCLAIKLSHRYKKNNRFFGKTMQHILFLRSKDIRLTSYLEDIVKLRQKETLSYSHPVLDTTKDAFFKDDIYTYDHDSIHEAVALTNQPAYKFYIREGSEVMTSKEKFFSLPDSIRLAGVYEETCVLALERSQIPNNFENIKPEHSFMMALEKVCTSITSGWFREYAWENYHKVMAMYKNLGTDDYIKRYKANEHMIRPFVRGDK